MGNDGALLIVVGDVTGKGLKAGMMVALLVGAVRTAAAWSSNPESILDALNNILLERGDAQATCLAMMIDRDGEILLVNAGHIPPYLNGDAIVTEGLLPLGIVDSM